ncbi:hypothetical protein ACTI_36460 [Actinoplanes sp. OR16]|uniref:hypothetical protein n=1 Tax=Actinoplanes sp. OR16 TaxID=946334 RepID=UPI000F6D32C3|nr:hypothetical protein [Actinoplanes sp. OR16]BBH66961.1 hypothetical protein ACTI_36460 [Actinoplanes sp. OR16]
MTGVALAAILTLISALIWADPELPADESVGEVVRVGVVEGQSVSGYAASARQEVAALGAAGDTWALITFTGYAGPSRLPALLAGAAVAQVYTRVPLAGTRTEVSRIPVYRLPGDVIDGMLAAAVARDREVAEYRRLGEALTGDGKNEKRLRDAYEVAARTAAQEASAYRAGCDCVFAAVVRAKPEVLSALAAAPAVRVVDPAPEVRQLDRTEFRPPLPEEETAVPSPSASVATGTPAPIPSSIGVPVTSASPESSTEAPPVSVLPSEWAIAVPSAADVSPVRDGFGTPSGTSGR